MEETYEVLDAIDENMHKLCEELGDYCDYLPRSDSEEEGRFNINDVIRELLKKW